MIDAWVLYNRVITWEFIFAFLPQSCASTGKRIWFEKCYRGTVFITEPSEAITEYIYLTTDAFLVERLAGRIK